MRKFLAVVFAIAMVQGVIAGRVKAQAGVNCTGTTVVGFTPGVGVVPTGWNCQAWGMFTFISICTFQNSSCAPHVAPQETCPTCPHAGRPISLATGNTYIEQIDLRIPGLGNGLGLVRTWHSQWPSSQNAFQVGRFGPNWRSTYEERVFLGDDGYMRWARSDGSFWSFGVGGPGWAVAAPANAGATLVQVRDSSGNSIAWNLVLKNGEQRTFSFLSGWLTQIADRNGNTTNLAYDALNRLTTVTDAASRQLTFTYASNTSLLVTGVSSSVGISLAYTYDAQNRLSQVTMPDLSTLNFHYDTNSMITSVTDSSGIVLESHTYDSSHRGLTSSRANGVEAVTIAY